SNLFLTGRCRLSSLPDRRRFPTQSLAFAVRCTPPATKSLGGPGFRGPTTAHRPHIVLLLPNNIVESDHPRYQSLPCTSLACFPPERKLANRSRRERIAHGTTSTCNAFFTHTIRFIFRNDTTYAADA